MRLPSVLAALPGLVAGAAIAQSLDGFRDCVRADDSRPVCISAATGSYHFVTEQFFNRYQAALGDLTVPASPEASPMPTEKTALPPAPDAATLTSTRLTAEELYALASQSIVVIGVVGQDEDEEDFIGQGSGVVVKEGRIITNCHVIKYAQAAGVFFHGELYDGVTLLDANTERDLCLLNAPGLPAPPIRLGSVSSLRIGQHVFAIGAPHGLDIGFDLTLSEGLVSSLRRQKDEYFPMIQTSAPISQGSSGGALLTADGLLIGITTMVHKEGQNLNFAVPVDWIRDFPAAR